MNGNPLVRTNNNHIKSVILIGNGIFTNGWVPLEKILHKETIAPFTQNARTNWFLPENRDLFLAYYAEHARACRSNLWLYYADKLHNFLDPQVSDELNQHHNADRTLFQLINEFRTILSNEYLNFSQEFQTVDFPKEIEKK